MAKERRLNFLEQVEHIYVLSGSVNFVVFATFTNKVDLHEGHEKWFLSMLIARLLRQPFFYFVLSMLFFFLTNSSYLYFHLPR